MLVMTQALLSQPRVVIPGTERRDSRDAELTEREECQGSSVRFGPKKLDAGSKLLGENSIMQSARSKAEKIQEGLERTIGLDAKLKIEQILCEAGQLSDVEKLLLYLKLPTGNTIGYTKEGHTATVQSSNRLEQIHAITWIKSHLEEHAETSLPKQEVFDDYKLYCESHGYRFLSQGDFGKVMKCVFPNVKPRRLGQRGQSKHCYGGLRKKLHIRPPTLPEVDLCHDLLKKEDEKEDQVGDEVLSASCELVCEWAQKLTNHKFVSIKELAEYLISNTYVNSRSMAAFTVLAAVQKAGIPKQNSSTTANNTQSTTRHRETTLHLQRKIQEREQLREQKRKLEQQHADPRSDGIDNNDNKDEKLQENNGITKVKGEKQKTPLTPQKLILPKTVSMAGPCTTTVTQNNMSVSLPTVGQPATNQQPQLLVFSPTPSQGQVAVAQPVFILSSPVSQHNGQTAPLPQATMVQAQQQTLSAQPSLVTTTHTPIQHIQVQSNLQQAQAILQQPALQQHAQAQNTTILSQSTPQTTFQQIQSQLQPSQTTLQQAFQQLAQSALAQSQSGLQTGQPTLQHVQDCFPQQALQAAASTLAAQGGITGQPIVQQVVVNAQSLMQNSGQNLPQNAAQKPMLQLPLLPQNNARSRNSSGQRSRNSSGSRSRHSSGQPAIVITPLQDGSCSQQATPLYMNMMHMVDSPGANSNDSSNSDRLHIDTSAANTPIKGLFVSVASSTSAPTATIATHLAAAGAHMSSTTASHNTTITTTAETTATTAALGQQYVNFVPISTTREATDSNNQAGKAPNQQWTQSNWAPVKDSDSSSQKSIAEQIAEQQKTFARMAAAAQAKSKSGRHPSGGKAPGTSNKQSTTSSLPMVSSQSDTTNTTTKTSEKETLATGNPHLNKALSESVNEWPTVMTNVLLSPNSSSVTSPSELTGQRRTDISQKVMQRLKASLPAAKTVSSLLKEQRGYGPHGENKAPYVNDRRPVAELLRECREKKVYPCGSNTLLTGLLSPQGTQSPILTPTLSPNTITIQTLTVSKASNDIGVSSVPVLTQNCLNTTLLLNSNSPSEMPNSTAGSNENRSCYTKEASYQSQSMYYTQANTTAQNKSQPLSLQQALLKSDSSSQSLESTNLKTPEQAARDSNLLLKRSLSAPAKGPPSAKRRNNNMLVEMLESSNLHEKEKKVSELGKRILAEPDEGRQSSVQVNLSTLEKDALMDYYRDSEVAPDLAEITPTISAFGSSQQDEQTKKKKVPTATLR